MQDEKDSPPPPAVKLMESLKLKPDPWQEQVLEGRDSYLLLNCCRQAGKSTVVAMLALMQAVWFQKSLVLILSPSFRQSQELYRRVTDFYRQLKFPLAVRQTVDELMLKNDSRIVALPCKEETIRGYSNVSLLVIDEAARVPDDLYRAVRPMLAVSGGKLVCLSTPDGKYGFFYEAWANGGNDWARIEVPAEKVSRIPADFLERERRSMRDVSFRREYCCAFEALEGLVYPDLHKCVVKGPPPSVGKRVGGIDFGVRNPFAALWGVLDREGVLWITHEYYSRERPLSANVPHLPPDVTWYVDSSGANERAEMVRAGYKVLKSNKKKQFGFDAVNARICKGTLRILEGTCPNLLIEAGKYRYNPDAPKNRAEEPIDEYNHALCALRYPIATLDQRSILGRLANVFRSDGGDEGKGNPPQGPAKPKRDPWLRYDNEALWTQVWP